MGNTEFKFTSDLTADGGPAVRFEVKQNFHPFTHVMLVIDLETAEVVAEKLKFVVEEIKRGYDSPEDEE